MPLKYIHSYGKKEQQRLLAQAKFLEPYIYPYLSFSIGDDILEIGCGVGAQIKTILKRHHVTHITGIDFSCVQISSAKKLLAKEVKNNTVRLIVSAGERLPFKDESFDAIYIFFVLEHVSNPDIILTEARRVLRQGGKFYCTEVFNAGLYIYPESVFLMDYWQRFNILQRQIGGHPDIGIRLANYAIDVGYQVEYFLILPVTLDQRINVSSKRTHFLNMLQELFLSAHALLIDKNMVSKYAKRQVLTEFAHLRKYPYTIFSYPTYQICARKI